MTLCNLRCIKTLLFENSNVYRENYNVLYGRKLVSQSIYIHSLHYSFSILKPTLFLGFFAHSHGRFYVHYKLKHFKKVFILNRQKLPELILLPNRISTVHSLMKLWISISALPIFRSLSTVSRLLTLNSVTKDLSTFRWNVGAINFLCALHLSPIQGYQLSIFYWNSFNAPPRWTIRRIVYHFVVMKWKRLKNFKFQKGCCKSSDTNWSNLQFYESY